MNTKTHKNTVNSDKLEINKPSELCQVLFYNENNKGITASISALEIDLINYILYESRKEIITNNIKFDKETSFKITLELKNIVNTLGKYGSGNFENILNYFRALRNKEIEINALKKNKQLVKSYTSFIHKITYISNEKVKNRKITILVDGEIIDMVLDVKNFFSKMYLSIQYSLKSKQSKLLYELLKDYEKIKTISFDFIFLVNLLNSNSERNKKFAYFNNDILKKTINEINEKTDILLDYEPIKDKVDGGRSQVVKIKFNIKKQSPKRLKELGLETKSISSHKFYKKSRAKLDSFVKNGYDVYDEEAWIEADITKYEDRYNAEDKIDRWEKETHDDPKNRTYRYLAEILEDCDENEDRSVIIENYKLVGVFSKDAFTRNPQETVELLNKVIPIIEKQLDEEFENDTINPTYKK